MRTSRLCAKRLREHPSYGKAWRGSGLRLLLVLVLMMTLIATLAPTLSELAPAWLWFSPALVWLAYSVIGVARKRRAERNQLRFSPDLLKKRH